MQPAKVTKTFRQADVDYMLMMFRQYMNHHRTHLKPWHEMTQPDNDKERQLCWEHYARGHYRASCELMRLFEDCLVEAKDESKPQETKAGL